MPSLAISYWSVQVVTRILKISVYIHDDNDISTVVLGRNKAKKEQKERERKIKRLC